MGTELVILSETKNKTMQEELKEDSIVIIHNFSNKLYDAREQVRKEKDKEFVDEM